jgi:signal transduction histidine kinase
VPLTKDTKDKFKQSLPIFIFSLAWILFVLSAFRYQGLAWFEALLWSRVFIVALGFFVVILTLLGRDKNRNWNNAFFSLTLMAQSFHGILEGANSVEFYSYTGVIFLVSSLGTYSNRKNWLQLWLPLQIFCVILPIFFKAPHLTSPISALVDNFSLPIAGLCLGLIVSVLNASRIESMQRNLALQNELLSEKENWNNRLVVEIEKLKEDLKNKANLEAYKRITDQVVHDIRSPLAAMRMVVEKTTFKPEINEKIIRMSLRRISEIATDLGHERQNLNIVSPKSTLIFPLVSTVCIEKKEEFYSICDLELESDDKSQSSRVFVVDSVLKRILSNLINNAIEARVGEKAQIYISLKSSKDSVVIEIFDKGKGIPAEILPYLGIEGFSFGKNNYEGAGSGLGLFHATQTIQFWKGTIGFDSDIKAGTRVSITLPINHL